MKTIKERAKEYADRHKATEINYFGVGKVYGYERIYNAEITAYERGATEQKAIDWEAPPEEGKKRRSSRRYCLQGKYYRSKKKLYEALHQIECNI